MGDIFVIKIGGNVIDDANALAAFLQDLSAVSGKKVLVHGGGKIATRMAEQLGIPQQIVEGRRITDAETLKIATMVYAGYVNKNIVAMLQANGCSAIGMSGADGNLVQSHKRVNASIDYGYVGDVDQINTQLIRQLFDMFDTIVVSSITHDNKGQLLNTNADTIAQEIAKALSKECNVDLVYCFEKKGVLLDINNEGSVVPKMDRFKFEKLKELGVIYEGMIPKLTNAFAAVDSGVRKVIIGNAAELKQIISGNAGTVIAHGE